MPETIAENKPERPRTKGIQCGPGVGKFLFRIRQTHIAEHYGELITAKAIGAVKLDLVLRDIALQPEHAGARPAGFVLWNWNYEHLHDLAKTAPQARSSSRRSDRQARHLKRKWISNQMGKLADLHLVKLKYRDGARPEIIMLSDLGRLPLDDPGAGSDWEQNWDRDRYVTIRGGVIASRTLAKWGAPEVAAYLAALHAEFYNERGAGRPPKSDGESSWWRQLAWFNNGDWQPTDRVLLPFSTTLLEEGLRAHVAAGLITKKQIIRNPLTKQKLSQRRMLYHDHFNKLDQRAIPVPADVYADFVEKSATLDASTETTAIAKTAADSSRLSSVNPTFRRGRPDLSREGVRSTPVNR